MSKKQQMIATQRMVYNNQVLEPGSPVELIGGRFDSLLIQNGAMVTPEKWAVLFAEQEAKAYEAKHLKPVMDRIKAAGEELEAAHNAVLDANSMAQVAASQYSEAKEELQRVINDGPALFRLNLGENAILE